MKWSKTPKGFIGLSNGEIKFVITKVSGMNIFDQAVDDIGKCELFMYETDYDERDEPMMVKSYETQAEAMYDAFSLDRKRKIGILKESFGLNINNTHPSD